MLRYCLALLTFTALAAPPELRLPETVRPSHYNLDLTLIPEDDTFSGHIDIDVDLSKPADVIWLNARNLNIDAAKIIAGGRSQAAKVQPGGKEFVGFALDKPVPAGKATLQIAYKGSISTKSSGGLFKQQDAGNWYIYSQFEALDARQAFPCFDEPSFKVPWKITLHVKKEHAALSNSRIATEADEPNGRKKVVFVETKPLPSYLVAVAAGPFEFVDAGKAGKNQVPLRIVTPKGKKDQAKYAAEVTAQLLNQLEDYFGMPYPYDKLDSIAVPLFGGAMENPGLITYGQTIILNDPAKDTIERQRGYASVSAHEMSHLWFGDLVTTAWWDDIWLNEAFASWMSSKIIAHWKPEWNTKISEQNIRLGAMGQDALTSARQIRQPIKGNDDIANAFDEITYSKGEIVIGMFENWMGEDAFRRGVRKYIQQYSWRNATSGDFLDSVGSTGNSEVGRAFSTFLNQPGVPVVSVALKCDTAAGPALHLSQKRALPLGSGGNADQTWQVPVCARYGEGDAQKRECTLLKQASVDWKLPGAKSCPAFVEVNADGTGYYRVAYEGDLLGKLLANGGTHLSPAGRVAALGDVQALTAMGEIKAGDALALVPQFSGDPIRQVTVSAVRIAADVRQHLVPPDLDPNYSRFIDKSFGERARQMGWNAKPGEDAETPLLRRTLLPLEAVSGGDHQLAAEARKIAESWLTDRKSVDQELAEPTLDAAAAVGDQKFYEHLTAALGNTTDRHERELIFEALAAFRDPAIVRESMNLILKPELDIRETSTLLFGPLGNRETSALPFEFVQKNYDAIVQKIPAGDIFSLGGFLPFVGGSFCDEKSLGEVKAFFEPKAKQFIGTPRNLAKALESIRLCIAYKAAQQASVAGFLKKY